MEEEQGQTGSFSLPRTTSSAMDEDEQTQEEEIGTVFKIVMIRSGDIEWDSKNVYCGWYDAKLTNEGRQQILKASNILKQDNYLFDFAYCSALSRCRDSLSIILNELDLQDIEVQAHWQLNERHFGCFTGYAESEVITKYGDEQAKFWLKNFTQAPPSIDKSHKYYNFIYNNDLYPKNESLPLTESVEMVHRRLIHFWKKNICPNILSGRKILLVSHNGCLQSFVQYLDDIDYYDFDDSEIPRSTPFYYKLDETLTPILKDSYNNISVVSYVNINNELDKKIADAFDIFDHAGNRTVDIREIGTIIRSLGCVPSEAEVQEILIATENPEATGSVHLSAFLPQMTKIFNEHKFQPATPDKLLEAFRKLDPEGLGYIKKDYLTKLMMEEGEPFTEDEIEEMMGTACDPQTQTIPYEYYINQLMYDPPNENNLYWLADKIKAETPAPKDTRTLTQILRAAEELDV